MLISGIGPRGSSAVRMIIELTLATLQCQATRGGTGASPGFPPIFKNQKQVSHKRQKSEPRDVWRRLRNHLPLSHSLLLPLSPDSPVLTTDKCIK
ncbi:hypothetical protein KQX54_003627 [Cotesia glomerata]|uniref:Secreted protein n=1 Tax=Cotesia glomerata TaxID=32391 RepID=A0AAV7I6R2_COTGL|nr:hypothetical protein KQX54_003627 [Cotesia glomerata]